MTRLPKTPPASSDFSTTLPFKLCWAWGGSLYVNVWVLLARQGPPMEVKPWNPQTPTSFPFLLGYGIDKDSLQNAELGTPQESSQIISTQLAVKRRLFVGLSCSTGT